ncbi:MAG: hypothetical protein DCC52_10840 [Chloroflexi bacterium]|nr:MAG: hypothetical protein DCC52_10840 [Chloroflexota bacterium]
MRHFPQPPPAPFHSQPIPLPGETVAMVQETNELPSQAPADVPNSNHKTASEQVEPPARLSS